MNSGNDDGWLGGIVGTRTLVVGLVEMVEFYDAVSHYTTSQIVSPSITYLWSFV